LKKLFAAMPPDSGLAFVLVPHLDPAHESLMAPLLARCTAMPVMEAQDGMRIEVDHVYVIPPNEYLGVSAGVLYLTKPRILHGTYASLDFFLRSLAQDLREYAICIIVSGTGSSGALGLKAVKASDGAAFVQDPATVEFPQMPPASGKTAPFATSDRPLRPCETTAAKSVRWRAPNAALRRTKPRPNSNISPPMIR
jgi:two-component system CheB/CheR fusion protein